MRGNSSSRASTGSLGTFGGVFTPSILTILGIILFLRLGYVVGSAGLMRALVIIGLANGISVLTSISLSAIATNLKVKSGGDYYLISRTLGLEFGGAIGIVLFLAQSVSIAFYCIGFGEAISVLVPDGGRWLPQIIAALAVSFLFIFAWLGADWATRFQYVVMSLLIVALISFFAGGFSKWDSALLAQNWVTPSGGPPFWVLFAIFFPAVTGFTQGVSMSGDLKDPGKSLPLGTFLAVGISIIVYFGVAIVFAGVLPGEIMRGDYGAMKKVAHFPFLINAGVIAATLSSALASFLGAPRILQSLASDRIFPFLLPFAKGFGPTGNPRWGVILSAGIAFTTIGLGNLNLVASVVTMFFLISYGLLNYATFYEARSASPSFRPRFRWFDLRLSLLGFLACLGVMLAIDVAAGVVAVSVLFAIYQYIQRTAGPARWADSSRSYHLQRVREHLLSAAEEQEHPRDWRPQLLAFSNDSHRRKQLLVFASWIQGGSGTTTAVRILEGEGVKMLKAQAEAEAELRADIEKHGVEAFPLVLFAPTLQVGLQTLVQGFGIGPLKANTILLNWFEHFPKGIFSFLKESVYAHNLKVAFRLGCNIVVLDAKKDNWNTLESAPSGERRIDVWWWDDETSRLMLLLAHLMKRNDNWSEAKIRVLSVSYGRDLETKKEELQKFLEEVRIDAEPEVVEDASTDSLKAQSADAALVFIPFRIRGNRLLGPFGSPLEELLTHMPVTALVLASEDIDLDAEPEEGKAGEMAEARDTLTDAKKDAEQAEREATEATKQAEKKKRKLEEARATSDQETIAPIKREVREAKEDADKAVRQVAKARSKAENAAREAETVGVKSSDEQETTTEQSDPKKVS
ncbi:MAG: amino acid permease, partial [Proteobacteria bacterium]|nr:amino acid permease [Pseudomonadota bacterium]